MLCKWDNNDDDDDDDDDNSNNNNNNNSVSVAACNCKCVAELQHNTDAVDLYTLCKLVCVLDGHILRFTVVTQTEHGRQITNFKFKNFS